MKSFPVFCLLLIFLSFAFSCKQGNKKSEIDARTLSGNPERLKYASNFEITQYEGFTKLKVKTPWKDADQSFTYIAYPRGSPKPDGFKNAVFIETPVRSLACVSTTHVALLDFLESTNLIKGISGTRYVYNPEVQKRIKNGAIKELGMDQDLDYEVLISLNPDVILTYGINANNNIDKIMETGLKPVVIAEFMDQSPLGRAEWVKFLAVLLGKSELAVAKFDAITEKYESLKMMVADLERPTVMVGMGFEGTWFVPAGESYVAKTIKDAGGSYLWEGSSGKITLSLDFEAVYEKARSAEKWINVGQVHSLKEISAVDERYVLFESWQNGEVYNGNARISDSGGYDIYESAVVNPHLVLGDLIKAFHPPLLSEEPFVYYRRLK